MGLLRHFFIWLLRSALCLWGKYSPTDGYANDEFQLWGIEGFSHHQLVPRFRIKESQVFLDDNLTIYSLCMFDKNFNSKNNNGQKFCQLFQKIDTQKNLSRKGIEQQLLPVRKQQIKLNTHLYLIMPLSSPSYQQTKQHENTVLVFPEKAHRHYS